VGQGRRERKICDGLHERKKGEIQKAEISLLLRYLGKKRPLSSGWGLIEKTGLVQDRSHPAKLVPQKIHGIMPFHKGNSNSEGPKLNDVGGELRE